MNSEFTHDMMLETAGGLCAQVQTNVANGIYQHEPFTALWGCIHWWQDMIHQLAGEG